MPKPRKSPNVEKVDLSALLSITPSLSPEDLAALGEGISKESSSVEAQAEFQKAKFVNSIIEGMRELSLSKSDVARKWKRSRQYVSQLLNEDCGVNFTIETMVEMAALLDRRVEIHVLRNGDTSHVLHFAGRRFDVPARPSVNPRDFKRAQNVTIDPSEISRLTNVADIA